MVGVFGGVGMMGGGEPVEEIYRVVGEAVAEVRKNRGMSQGELAMAAGIAQGSLSEIEAGQVRFAMGDLEKIAKALAVAPRVLLQGVQGWT